MNSDSNAQHSFNFFQALCYRMGKILAAWIGSFSPTTVDRLARILGWVLWHSIPARRAKAVRSIQKHLHVSQEEATRIGRASFTENSRSFLEIFQIPYFKSKDSITTIISDEVLQTLTTEKTPVVITAAHMGSWELMASLVDDFLPDRQRKAVVRSPKNPVLKRLIFDLRGSRGMKQVGHRSATSEVMQLLRNNGIVAFLVDHNCSRKEAIFLPFLGETAAVNSGPAMLALRAKAVVYPMFLLRKKGKHEFYLYPPLNTTTLDGSISERVTQIATYYTECVADFVVKHPEQWFWMHDRWKTQPKS